jgi:hypothetical protein
VNANGNHPARRTSLNASALSGSIIQSVIT